MSDAGNVSGGSDARGSGNVRGDGGGAAREGRQLVVVDGGVLASVQDLGRADAARWGVPRAGAVDGDALRLGNGLVGNPPGAAAIEVLVGGAELVADGGAVRVALACFGGPGGGPGGGARLEVTGPGRRVAPAWVAMDVPAGGHVRVVPGIGAGARAVMSEGPAYLVVAGGVDVPVILGSRSTDLRGGFGGWEGRRLASGDALPVGTAPTGTTPRDPTPAGTSPTGTTPREPTPAGTSPRGTAPAAATANGCPAAALVPPPSGGGGPLRVVAGPQVDRLAGDALAALCSGPYVVGPDADRMGLRLSGPALPWADDGRPEMLSVPVVPGVVQVPRSGEPILLSADAQTTGGYPQVAVVCTADLARAGRLRPGDRARFAVVTVAEAHALRREHEAALAALLARARRAPPHPDLSALHEANLVSGVVDGVVDGVLDAADG